MGGGGGDGGGGSGGEGGGLEGGGWYSLTNQVGIRVMLSPKKSYEPTVTGGRPGGQSWYCGSRLAMTALNTMASCTVLT